MKTLQKLLVCLLICLGVFMTVGCGEEKKDLKVIGIIKYVTDEALDNARSGIISKLEENGFKDGENIKIKDYNPEANASDLSMMVEQAVEECDMIFAIATPVAQTLKTEVEKQGSDVPVLFTAVTDPVASGIMKDKVNHEGTISGTNDMNPVAKQVGLLKDLNPEATKLGVIFTSSENNSIIQVELAEAECAKLGIELVKSPITTVNDLETATQDLCDKGVDAIYLPTDNIIAANMNTVAKVTTQEGVVTICGESGMVRKGGVITYGIDYTELGKITGQMGADVLKGTKTIQQIECVGLENVKLVVNKKLADESGITIPEAVLAKADEVITK